MNVWAWLCLIAGFAAIGGIWYVDRQYRKRDRAERAENERRRHQDADWFV
jgi:hypothetical protein